MATVANIASFVAGGILTAGAFLLLQKDEAKEKVPVPVNETPAKETQETTLETPTPFKTEVPDTARTAETQVEYQFDAYVAGFFKSNPLLENLIELLKESSVKFNMEEIEETEKSLSDEHDHTLAKSKHLVYIIDSGSKGVVSLMEVARIMSANHERFILAVEDLEYSEQTDSHGAKIFVSSTGETLTMEEIRETQTGRGYLRKLSKQLGCPCYDDSGLMIADFIAKYE